MRGLVVILVLVGLIAGGISFLMFKDIPANQKVVEKDLDTSQFIRQ